MKALAIAPVLLALVLVTPAVADGWQWSSPMGGNVSRDDMTVRNGSPSAAVRITTSQPGDLQWYYAGLAGLPAGSQIDSITVCYELEDPASFISQIRIGRMNAPDANFVVFDDPTDLVSPVATCVTYPVSPAVAVTGSISIGYRCNFASSSHWIEVGAIGIHLTGTVTASPDGPSPAVRGSLLDQNRPNPFNPSTTIAFDLPRPQRVQVSVYTVDGKRVATLRDGTLAAGRHEITWNGRDAKGRPQASGVYLYRLETAQGVESRRMTLVR